QCYSRACEQLSISRFDDKLEPSSPNYDAKLELEVAQTKRRIYDNLRSDVSSQNKIWQHGLYLLNILIENDGFARPQAEMILSSMIVLGYTAFEVLAQELLYSSVKENRHIFPHVKEKVENYQFQSRLKMKAAYREVFPVTKINNLFDSQVFNGVAILRNLFVHSGGIVDKRFKDDCKKNGFKKWESLPKGSSFPITGSLVNCFLSGASNTACSLIKSVDNYLIDQTSS
ncbi:MAG: hypothetical protein ABIP97_08510, partial [Chthoniobacterales bacterium]